MARGNKKKVEEVVEVEDITDVTEEVEVAETDKVEVEEVAAEEVLVLRVVFCEEPCICFVSYSCNKPVSAAKGWGEPPCQNFK